MCTIINIHLLLAACEYTSVSAERKTNPKTEMTHCWAVSHVAIILLFCCDLHICVIISV